MMNESIRQGRVLCLDDQEFWRKQVMELLGSANFRVHTVGSIAQLNEKLEEDFYHLLLLDIQLDETNGDDKEGISLLGKFRQSGQMSPFEVAVFSSHEDYDLMREAIKHKAADYFSKGRISKAPPFKNEKFIDDVKEIFDTKMKVNLSLNTMWDGVNGPEDVTGRLEVNGKLTEPGTALHACLAAELDDLLCRLFYNAETVLVRPLTPGYSGAGVLSVEPSWKRGGVGKVSVVKFGDYTQIEKEYGNFKKYIEPFIGGGHHTSVATDGVRRTVRLGGIVYSFLGMSGQTFESFDKFYGRADISQIKGVLDRLFNETCGRWYASRSQLKHVDLTGDYQELLHFTEPRLRQALSQNMPGVLTGGADGLFFSALGSRMFTNPLNVMASKRFILPTYVCTTHGDFNAKNIMVDVEGNPWLIDFQRTGQGHILRDVAELDSVVRIELLSSNDASLEERRQMEEALLSVSSYREAKEFAAGTPTGNPAVDKAFATATHLRAKAGELIASNPTSSMKEYNVALFYYALNAIKFDSLEPVQREHALLCASLLADKL